MGCGGSGGGADWLSSSFSRSRQPQEPILVIIVDPLQVVGRVWSLEVERMQVLMSKSWKWTDFGHCYCKRAEKQTQKLPKIVD